MVQWGFLEVLSVRIALCTNAAKQGALLVRGARYQNNRVIYALRKWSIHMRSYASFVKIVSRRYPWNC